MCGTGPWVRGKVPVRPGAVLMPHRGGCQLVGSQLVVSLGSEEAPLAGRKPVPTQPCTQGLLWLICSEPSVSWQERLMLGRIR